MKGMNILYKYDMHIHTGEVSPCGAVAADEMVRIYKEHGYQGMVITDHYRKRFFRGSKAMTWADKVDDFLEGYYKAKSEGDKLGLDVLLGLEIAFMENKEMENDYLIYGVSAKMLKETPDLLERGLEGVKAFCDTHNCLLYQAHPLRDYCNLVDLNLLHGVESYNGNPRHDSHNEDTLKIAMDNQLSMVAGSDFHNLGDEDRGGILVHERIKNNDDLLAVLRANNHKIYRGQEHDPYNSSLRM